VVFALHDLVRDAPFSRLDLISCRNLLIYLSPELQQRILRLFHHALRPGGILFLGGAESPGAQTDLFEPLDAGARVFRRREAVRALALPDQLRSWQPTRNPGTRTPPAPGRPPSHKTVEERARQRLLRRYGPPAVVVDDHLDVVFYSTRGLGLFAPPVGPPTGNLLKLLAEGLRPAVRAAIHGCRETGKEVRYRGVLMDQERRRPVDVMAEPLGSGGELEDLVLVSFEVAPEPEVWTSPAPGEREEEPGEEPEGTPSWTMVQRLEEQLGLSRDELNDTVERLETVNEELTGSNEELMSMNEELQASNEELEASKEELQAVNEELLAVNAELEEKVKELARANDDMTNLIVSSQAATVFLDRELRIQRMTPAAANTLDLDRTRDRGRGAALLSDRLGGIDVEGAAAEVLESLDTAKMDATTEGGQHFSVRLRPYRTAEDEIEGVALSLFDVTELEATRSRLASERAVLDAIFHATDVALAYLGPDLGVVSANGAFGEFCGVPVESLRDCLLDDDLLPDVDFAAQLRTALQEDRSIRLTDRAMEPPGRDGVSFWDVGVSPVHAGDLRPSGLIVTMRETTDRVATLAELRESEERHRVMGEIIPYGVWLTDAEGRARYISPSFLEMTGLTLEEARGLGWAQALHPDTRAASVEAWTDSLERGHPFEHEHRFVGVDGETRMVLAKGLPIRDDAGVVTGWAGINLDITDQKAAEEERVALAAEVERGRRLSALGVVSAGVAHEFNNLLAIFMGAADLLLEEPVDAKTVEECARTILATAGRGRSVVSQIMSVGRPPDPKPGPVSLPELMREVVEELRLSRRGPGSSGAELTVRHDPPAAWVDRDHLAQVLHNLLDNARRSMHEADRAGGSIRVVVEEMVASELPVTLGTAREGTSRWVRISVADDGPGVPADAEEKIFQPFFSTRPTGEGTGLGLPVARSLVLANGGWMGLGRGDGGAVFQVILPAVPAVGGAESPAEPGGSGALRDGPLSGRRIVVVDDERELVRLLCRALDRAGFACEGYHQAGQALERLRSDPSSLDLLITDAKMPEVQGARLVQELRRLRPELPVIVYSGQDELKAAELEVLRVDRLLTKPVPLGGLVAAVRDLLAADDD
jgi:two-component system CheB/CheR fusion protein